MRNRELAAQIIRLMIAAILLTLAMVAGTLAWTAREHDRKAAEDTRRMVEGGLSAAVDRMRGLVLDYSIWDAAQERALARDIGWLYDNMGTGVDDLNFDVLAIVWPEDGATVQWIAGGDGQIRSDAVPQPVIGHMAARLADVALGSFEAVTAIAQLGDGQVYILAASRIESYDQATDTDPGSLPVNIMGQALTLDWAQALGRSFLIDDLALVFGPPARGPALTLAGIDGAPLAWLAWSAPRPGAAMVRAAILPLSVALAAFLGLAVTVTVLARRSARELVASELESARLARTDSLTGLPNRMAFSEALGRSLKRMHAPCALLTLDVNGFKRINDTVGHGGGDALIVQLADRLRAPLPEDATLSRMGGDEFSAIFRGADAEPRVQEYCAALARALEPPFLVGGHSFQVGVAAGYAVCNTGATPPSELVRQSDLAMFEAKNRRMAGPMRYDSEMESDARRQKQIETALRLSMDRSGDLAVHYQPICDAGSSEMTMAEALLRWTSPELGRVAPDRFIPIAETSGLIVALGYRLIDQVCRDLRSWPQLRVSVNVSPAQLREPDFIDRVAAIVARHGVDPRRIEIELTEGLVVENPDMAAFRLDSLREAGHRIALDDFGTGFSSIGYLRRMNFDKLKIDKAFVDDIGVNPDAESLLRSLALLARSLRLTTVAEGVEGAEQAARLREIGFDLLQGYHFGQAMPLGALRQVYGNRMRRLPA